MGGSSFFNLALGLVTVAFAYAGPSVASDRFDLNDVSILFPLDTRFPLLTPSTLLPASLVDTIPRLHPGGSGIEREFQALRVVSARIDPCFKYQEKGHCFPQLRLVWQPIYQDGKQWRAEDAAFHSFYNLSKDRFWELAQSLKKVSHRISKPGKPLGVHPAYGLQTLGLASDAQEFHKRVKTLILRYASTANLSRVTFMRTVTVNAWWAFGGFDYSHDNSGGVFKTMALPKVQDGDKTQIGSTTPEINLFNDPDAGTTNIYSQDSMFAAINPQSQISLQDQLFNSLHGSKDKLADWAADRAREALLSVERLENPITHSAVTLDCAHCHVTGPARSFLTTTLRSQNRSLPSAKETMVARFKLDRGETYDLSNTSSTQNYTRSMRAFGYYGNLPSVNRRTIHESALIARKLNSESPPR